MQELLNILNSAKSSLDNYYEIHKFEIFFDKRNSPKDYLEWIDKKTKIIINSPEFIGKSKEYIFNINPISIERIDFTKKKGNIKGIDLDNISKAFLESDLFKYLPSKNFS